MIRYQVDNGRATLTIDDPERRNPLSVDVLEEMVEVVKRTADDSAVGVLVITGGGEGAFSAGGDLSARFVDQGVSLHRSRGALVDLFRALWRLSKPTIARVNGHALAGGFGLAVSCDIVVAVDEAKFGTPEINVGLWPMMVSTLLARAIPRKTVLELMLSGRLIDAEEAQRVGAVSRVVSRSELDQVVDEIAQGMLAKSRAILSFGRDSFYAMESMATEVALDYLQGGLTELALTEDTAEGVTAFAEKRPPVWKNR